LQYKFKVYGKTAVTYMNKIYTIIVIKITMIQLSVAKLLTKKLFKENNYKGVGKLQSIHE
jgi:hypothetical protein